MSINLVGIGVVVKVISSILQTKERLKHGFSQPKQDELIMTVSARKSVKVQVKMASQFGIEYSSVKIHL